jgi:signal transduction histidine kinase
MRKGTPWLLVLTVGLLVLLASVAVLQYRWLGEVSEAGRQRMESTLRARAEQFAEEFDREIARAFFWLQVNADAAGRKDWSRYAERYDRWLATTGRPRLVREIWFLAPGTSPQRFNPDTRLFETAPVPPALAPFWKEAEAELLGRTGEPHTGIRWFHSIRDEIPAIVVPLPQLLTMTPQKYLHIEQLKPSARLGFTVILLDRGYLHGEMLPQLAARHFGTAESSEYHVTIASGQSNRPVFTHGPPLQHASGSPDTTLPLFDIRLETLADFRAASQPGSGPLALPPTVIIRTPGNHAEPSAPPGVTIDRRMALSIVQQEGRVKTARTVSLPGPRWQLVIRHRAGSLEAAVAAGKRRNLMLSSGILVLFASSIVLLVMSVRRASRLAAQQVEFVAAVSHELRTPLAVIRSAGENLADGVVSDPDQVRRYGDLVRSEGIRLSSMVEQVLAFAGIRGGQALRRSPEDVRDVIERATESASADLQEAGLRVECDVPPGLPALSIDGGAIGRALANLLTNAAKYAPQSGVVRITASVRSERSREVEIAVEDYGPGIAPDDLPHVFEPFFRAPAVMASHIHGTGLGLSLVQAIARAHGGRVTVRSDVGRGSTFTLHLPHAASRAAAAARQPLPVSRS